MSPQASWKGKLKRFCWEGDRKMAWPSRTTMKPESPTLAACRVEPSSVNTKAVEEPCSTGFLEQQV